MRANESGYAHKPTSRAEAKYHDDGGGFIELERTKNKNPTL